MKKIYLYLAIFFSIILINSSFMLIALDNNNLNNLDNKAILKAKFLKDNLGLSLKPVGAKKLKLSLSKEKINTLLKKILKNSEDLLRSNSNIINKFANREFDLDQDSLFKLFLDNPICFLTECNANDCLLTRLDFKVGQKSFNLDLRKKFENELIDHIKMVYPDKSKKLIYTGFASGRLFSDLIILTKLINDGYKNIDIHLIDKSWDIYFDFIKNNGTEVQVDINKKIKHKSLIKLYSYVFFQFSNWLNIINNSNLNFFIYKSTNDYLKLNVKSDICIGIDFLNGDFIENAVQDYVDLIKYGTKDNSISASLVCNSFFPFGPDPLEDLKCCKYISHNLVNKNLTNTELFEKLYAIEDAKQVLNKYKNKNKPLKIALSVALATAIGTGIYKYFGFLPKK